MSERFTFKKAKEKIKELEAELDELKAKAGDQLEELKYKAGNVILDTSDNVFTGAELKKIRMLEAWAIIGPIAGLLIGLLF